MAHTNLVSLFSDIADAIREKTGENGLIKADDFPTAISAIQTGGGGGGDVASGEFTLDTTKISPYQIVSISELGFTPSFFAFVKLSFRDVQVQASHYTVLAGIRENVSDEHSMIIRVRMRTITSGNTVAVNAEIDEAPDSGFVCVEDGYIVVDSISPSAELYPGDYFWVAVK